MVEWLTMRNLFEPSCVHEYANLSGQLSQIAARTPSVKIYAFEQEHLSTLIPQVFQLLADLNT